MCGIQKASQKETRPGDWEDRRMDITEIRNWKARLQNQKPIKKHFVNKINLYLPATSNKKNTKKS